MKKTVFVLADGREIIYFDETDRLEREYVDGRDLPARPAPPDIRYDPLRDEHVVIAAHRQGRTHLPPPGSCPLCPSTPDRRTEVPASTYDVVVFENRFPSLAEDAGRCEVICFAPEHDLSFVDLRPERVRTVLEAWSDRTEALTALTSVEEVFCFENRGEEIGVTLHHPHGQIYAYPFVTPHTRRVLESTLRHHERTGRDLFADILAAEQRAEVRVIARTRHWTAFVPEAARWPVEIHLYPHRKVPDIPALNEEERDDFCRVYLDVLRRLDRLFDTPLPYVAAWHQAPARVGRDLTHLRLEIFSIRRAPGRLKYLAGSESAKGVFINDVVPEELAERLRQVDP